MKLDDLLATLTESLREQGIQQPIITNVVKELRAAAEEEAASKPPKAPKATLQTVLLLDDPEGKLTTVGPITGWAIMMDDSAPPAAVLDRIRAAALSFNRTKAGRQKPVVSIGETLAVVKGRHWKDESSPNQKTKVVNRELTQSVLLTNTNGKI